MGKRWTEEEVIHRILDNIRINEDGCWIYKDRRTWDAAPYKKVYVYCLGAVPDGLHLDHLCNDRACINPWHLEPVTPSENRRRAYQEQ